MHMFTDAKISGWCHNSRSTSSPNSHSYPDEGLTLYLSLENRYKTIFLLWAHTAAALCPLVSVIVTNPPTELCPMERHVALWAGADPTMRLTPSSQFPGHLKQDKDSVPSNTSCNVKKQALDFATRRVQSSLSHEHTGSYHLFGKE